MEEILYRGREEAAGPLADSSEQGGGRAEGRSGLRTASEAAAVVSAGVLVGGGAGMLAGVALGAINPFVLGLMGAAAGAGVPGLLKAAIVARGPERPPWWRKVFGG